MKKATEKLLSGIFSLFLTSYIVMLILGAEGLTRFSYWNVVGFLYIIMTASKLVKSGGFSPSVTITSK